jgi:hypothetical protein
MPIETNNLVLYKSERLTDTSDGGGKYSGQVVIDGESNNLFPDVSELDRTMGRVSLRKIYAAVNNNDTESLMGSTVFISKIQMIRTFQHCYLAPKAILTHVTLHRIAWKTIWQRAHSRFIA